MILEPRTRSLTWGTAVTIAALLVSLGSADAAEDRSLAGVPDHPPSPAMSYASAEPPATGTGPLAPALRDGVPALSATDLDLLKKVIAAYRSGETEEGDRLRAGLADPAAKSLTEWVALRSGVPVSFTRIVAFMRDEPDWPGGSLAVRRAEEALLSERRSPAVVRAFFASRRPTTASGYLALALAFQSEGSQADAAALVRDAWYGEIMSDRLEQRFLEAFPGVLSRADHRRRMEWLLLRENWTAARRAAKLAGGDHLKLVDARRAVEQNARSAGKALDAVPASLRTDSSYLFSKARALRRTDKPREAAKLIETVGADPAILADGDAWWVERRVIARDLLDVGEERLAYEVARKHAAQSDAQRIEAEFHAGWIALRFLKEPGTAAEHFANAAKFAETPISASRVAYWRGRAAEAAGDETSARRHYEKAAQHSIAYYGQLARGKLGKTTLPLRAVEQDSVARRAQLAALPAARAIRYLHAIDEGDLAIPLYVDLGRSLDDAALLHALGDLAIELHDPRGLLAIGKAAIHRGLPLDLHAYPTLGIPSFQTVGSAVEKAMVFAIARQESAFNPQAKSHAGARGLMQLMPATAKRTAQRFGIDFDLDRLLSDPAYNAKLGSAHLGELMEDWKGSYVLAFASYNAGGGNVKKWIGRFGDPRSPEVDPVDWVERIPFTETRNYVQRVMENFQVYRHRLNERSALVLESDLRRGSDR